LKKKCFSQVSWTSPVWLCFPFAISFLAIYLANIPGRSQRYLRMLKLFSSNSVFHSDVTDCKQKQEMQLPIYADNHWSLSPVTFFLFTAGVFWLRYFTVKCLTNPLICLDVITMLYSILHRLTYWQIFRRVRQIARGDY
jgi:hypothetical protein